MKPKDEGLASSASPYSEWNVCFPKPLDDLRVVTMQMPKLFIVRDESQCPVGVYVGFEASAAEGAIRYNGKRPGSLTQALTCDCVGEIEIAMTVVFDDE